MNGLILSRFGFVRSCRQPGRSGRDDLIWLNALDVSWSRHVLAPSSFAARSRVKKIFFLLLAFASASMGASVGETASGRAAAVVGLHSASSSRSADIVVPTETVRTSAVAISHARIRARTHRNAPTARTAAQRTFAAAWSKSHRDLRDGHVNHGRFLALGLPLARAP